MGYHCKKLFKITFKTIQKAIVFSSQAELERNFPDIMPISICDLGKII